MISLIKSTSFNNCSIAMKTRSLILLIVSSAFAVPLEEVFDRAELSTSRIVGGAPARRNEFPYQISFQLNGQHTCGGSILTPTWVVTAGHCLGTANETVIVAGMLNQEENHPDVQKVGVLRQISHPDYPGGVAPNDIALLELTSPLSWSSAVQPVSLPKEDAEFSGNCWVTGWGFVSSANPSIPTTLQVVQLRLLTFQECADSLTAITGGFYPLDDTMVCLKSASTGYENICNGDSGGPAVQNGILIGITSWTLYPCGIYEAPSMFTKVSKHIDFIKQYVPGV